LIPSQLEMALGLKQALSLGLFRSFNAFANPNGDPLIRFIFPGDAQKVEKTLQDLGLDKAFTQLTGKITHAMIAAVSVSHPLFVKALDDMTIKDASHLLITDNPHAATDYFKESMKPSMIIGFRPIIDSTIKTEGADQDWNRLASIYNSIPFIAIPLESHLNDFISARVIDLIFLEVASEEENIRSQYSFRKTDLLKKVFGYAERQLKIR
jgi:hypothetical protein